MNNIIKETNNPNFDHQIKYPAIYRHHKHTEQGSPNNYIYATMFVSKPVSNYKEEVNGLFSTIGVSFLKVMHTEKEQPLFLFEKDGQYYHDSAEEESELMIYKSLYDSNKLPYARPLQMFASLADKEKYPEATQKYRFEQLV